MLKGKEKEKEKGKEAKEGEEGKSLLSFYLSSRLADLFADLAVDETEKRLVVVVQKLLLVLHHERGDEERVGRIPLFSRHSTSDRIERKRRKEKERET